MGSQAVGKMRGFILRNRARLALLVNRSMLPDDIFIVIFELEQFFNGTIKFR